MATSCRGCHREISPGQPNCHVCGAPQGFLRFHRKSIITVILITGVISALGYGYLDYSIKQIESNKAQLTNAETLQAKQNAQQVEEQLQQVNDLLAQARSETEQAKIGLSQANETIANLNAQLVESQKKSEESEKRAGWLNKVNKQLKKQVDELSSQIPPTSQNNSAENSGQNNLQVEAYQKELTQLQSQQQALLANIAMTKNQLEQSWRQDDGNTTTQPTVEQLAARAAQMDEATKNSHTQLELLNQKINALTLKIAEAKSPNQ